MISLDDTYGAFLIGVIFAGVLYGCICVQTWYYYTHYPSDRWYIKLLVAGVISSETCQQCLLTHATYTYLITHFGDLGQLGKNVWSESVGIFFDGFTIFLVQSFLTMRVYRLSKKSWIATAPVIIIVITQFVMILVLGANAVRLDARVQLATLETLTMATDIIGAGGDFFIALLLCLLLQRSRTGFQKSDTLINRLIMFSISTGLLTSLYAIASLICIVAWPRTFIYAPFNLSVSRLYCSSLLVTLNVRKKLREDSRNDGISFCQGSHVMTNRTKLGSSSSRVPNNISIKVDTTQEYVRDEYSLSGDMKDPEIV